jgi:hypothetical protein
MELQNKYGLYYSTGVVVIESGVSTVESSTCPRLDTCLAAGVSSIIAFWEGLDVFAKEFTISLSDSGIDFRGMIGSLSAGGTNDIRLDRVGVLT